MKKLWKWLFGTRKKQLDIPVDINSDKCKCEQKGRTVWRIGANGKCLRCGGHYL